MITFVNRLFQIYVLEDGSEFGVDPYHSTAFAFGLDEKVVYLFGQLATQPLSRKFYVEAWRKMTEKGYTHFIYYSAKRRKTLGGDPLHSLLPGFWLVTL
jgi:hypothetical protein